MSLKLEIKSLDVLESILQDESGEVSLDIKQYVISEFTKKYLKPLMNTEVIQNCLNKTKQEIAQQHEEILKEYIGVYKYNDGWKKKLVLNDSLKQQITQHIKESFSQIVTETIQKQKGTIDVLIIDSMEKYIIKTMNSDEMRNKLFDLIVEDPKIKTQLLERIIKTV